MHVKERYLKITFAFVTTIQDAEIRRAAMKEVAADYLNQPFTCETLLEVVRQIFRK